MLFLDSSLPKAHARNGHDTLRGARFGIAARRSAPKNAPPQIPTGQRNYPRWCPAAYSTGEGETARLILVFHPGYSYSRRTR
jgi:hypothetical protein